MQNKHSFRVLVMGVSGSGKSTVGELLARALACRFFDGDDFHPESNIAKMKSGEALNDNDRLPWLKIIAEQFKQASNTDESVVIACSALKKSYRDVLRTGDANLQIVHLAPDLSSLKTRTEQRNHFMPAALLQSQLDTLEAPLSGEQAICVNNEQEPKIIIPELVAWLQRY